jgi:hypothetical protein
LDNTTLTKTHTDTAAATEGYASLLLIYPTKKVKDHFEKMNLINNIGKYFEIFEHYGK